MTKPTLTTDDLTRMAQNIKDAWRIADGRGLTETALSTPDPEERAMLAQVASVIERAAGGEAGAADELLSLMLDVHEAKHPSDWLLTGKAPK